MMRRPRSGENGRTPSWLPPLAACGLALALADCSGAPTRTSDGPHASELKYGVKSSPRVVAEGEPVPKGGGRDMTGKPYVVAGRTYVPTDGRGYDQEGWASWYGTAFHGRLTANGEVFDRGSVAAAHPTLPLPSYVRVTNIVTKRSMIVRVNDRGPYERDRLIDLSERAADALGFHRRGTSRVRVQYVGRASLNGSDDEKLLASLTTDGSPARLEGTQPVMLAKAGSAVTSPEARSERAGPSPIRVAEARAAPPPREASVGQGLRARPAPTASRAVTIAEPTRAAAKTERAGSGRTRTAAAETDDDAPDKALMPPRRPSFR